MTIIIRCLLLDRATLTLRLERVSSDCRLAERAGVLLLEPLADAGAVEHMSVVTWQSYYFVIFHIVLEADRALFVRVFRQLAHLYFSFLELLQQSWDALVILTSIHLDEEGYQVGDQR